MTEALIKSSPTTLYDQARNPVWSNANQTRIDLEVDFSFIADEWVQFTASADDNTGYGPELFARAVAGDFGTIGPYVAPPLPVPASITRRQCARELFNRQMITGQEMVAMTATGTPPAMIETMFNTLDDSDQWIARADFAADTYVRTHPLFTSIMLASGSTNEDIDQFFREAAVL
jgi:hypothetical protein